jgi:hypothetical protein
LGNSGRIVEGDPILSDYHHQGHQERISHPVLWCLVLNRDPLAWNDTNRKLKFQ